MKRTLVIIPARFSEDASALRYEAEVAAAKLLDAVWEAGGEPLVVHPTALGEPRLDKLQQRLRMADAIVVPSTYLRDVFARHGYRARLVPNIVDLSRFRYRERRPLRPRSQLRRSTSSFSRRLRL